MANKYFLEFVPRALILIPAYTGQKLPDNGCDQRLTCICAIRINYQSVWHNNSLPIFIAKTVCKDGNHLRMTNDLQTRYQLRISARSKICTIYVFVLSRCKPNIKHPDTICHSRNNAIFLQSNSHRRPDYLDSQKNALKNCTRYENSSDFRQLGTT